MRISVRRPSPALVISCVALTVALGGTSYATVLQVPKNSVGTPQLKNSAVTTAKVKNRTLLRADFAPGQLAAGPAGPVGPAGPAGPSGPAGVSGVERIETSSPSASTTTRSVFLACPTGKRLIGGGARVNGGSPRVAILTSFPDNDNIWRASAGETTATASSWTLTVYAICAITS
jgi:hypothetical protein